MKGLLIDCSLLPLRDARDVGHFLRSKVCQDSDGNIMALGMPLLQLGKCPAQDFRGEMAL